MADGVGDEIEFFPDVLVPLPALQSMAQVVEGTMLFKTGAGRVMREGKGRIRVTEGI